VPLFAGLLALTVPVAMSWFCCETLDAGNCDLKCLCTVRWNFFWLAVLSSQGGLDEANGKPFKVWA
jgi:hypothetical protein